MLKRFLIFAVLLALVLPPGQAVADMADIPVFLVSGAEPNVLFNMSVETPMGGAAYNDQDDTEDGGSCGGRVWRGTLVDGVWKGGSVGICYSASSSYLGYFDPDKCYSYDSTNNYFSPNGPASATHTCSNEFSGNFMNWASMTAIDMFSLTMTGGDRETDTTSLTVVQRSRKQNNDNWFPPKYLYVNDNVAPSSVTPWSDARIHIYNNDTGTGEGFIPKIQFGTTYQGSEKGTYNLRVKVCDPVAGLESNCTGYNNNSYYKPEGLVQENARSMRFAVTSYTADNSQDRDGGVLRSNMKYVGPTAPDGSGSYVSNSVKEYGTDGRYLSDPEGLAGSGGVDFSGVINYINKFSHYGYKSYDPIGELYYESLRYFKNLDPTPEYSSGLTDSQKGGFPVLTSWTDPYLYNCQKSFIIGINDANPWLDKTLPGTRFSGSTYNGQSLSLGSDYGQPSNPPTGDDLINVSDWTDQVGAAQGIHGTYQLIGCTEAVCDWDASNLKLITKLSKVAGTSPWGPKQNSYYIAGLAYYANVHDIRPDLGDADTSTIDNDPQTVSTFMVDTQEYSNDPLTGEMNMLWLAGKFGGFIDSNDNQLPDLASEWDADGDGVPDNYVLATKPDKLVAALRDAFLNVKEQKSSVAALAANSTRLNTVDPSMETVIYQASFNTADWSGTLNAIRIDTSASLGTVKWSTDEVSKIPAHASRSIFTYKDNVTRGQAFTVANWANLSGSMTTALNDTNDATIGKLRLNYLRGDTSNEQQNGGIFRNRPRQTGLGLAPYLLLGDIINSSPAYVVAPDFDFDELPEGTAGADSYNAFVAANKSRTPMLYVGANDGMLHGFIAETGVEKFAYIPNSLSPKLPQLTYPNYAHKYYVDGTPFVGDAYIDNPWNGSTGAAWRTVLVASTGAGSRSIYALDITDPDNFDASDVMWEFTDPDLGYVLGTPITARMPDGTWVVIFGNGYESANDGAFLFIVNLQTGVLIKKIDTEVGSSVLPNGLGTPALKADEERTIEFAYAGDLQGNLWKFDLSGNINSWDSEFSSGGDPRPLFTARNAAGQVQPITATPNFAKHPAGGYMVHVGTGKFFEDTDKIVGASPQIQSHYAIYDDGTYITTTNRSELVEQSFTEEVIHSSGTKVRLSSLRPLSDFDWTGDPKTRGWYIDMTLPVSGPQGERIVEKALLRHGRVIINSLTPVTDPCGYGGTSALTELDALTGNRLSAAPLDVDGDGDIDADDLADSSVVSTVEYNSMISGMFVLSTTGGGGGVEYKMGTKTDNTILIQAEDSGDSMKKGRRSWRQLP
jgi:type IV pilus assembly protein PilY1